MPLFLLLVTNFPIILIIIIFYFQSVKQSRNAKKLHLPGPAGLPLIGNLHQLDGRCLHTYLHRLSSKYGPVMSLKLGFRRVVVISSADVVKEIMKSHDVVFSSRPLLVSLHKLSYNGRDMAFSPYNEAWREMRKICTVHLFSRKKLVESFLPVLKDEVSKMMEKIATDAASSTVTDLSEAVMSFSMNTICRVAFGKSSSYSGDGEKRFSDLLHEVVYLLGGFFVEDYLPWFRWIDRLSGMSKRLDKNFLDWDSFYQQLIQEHMDRDIQSVEGGGDVVDTLLEIRRNGSSSFDLTFDHIKALLANIINGGSDSPSATIVWAMAALMKKPLLMKKLQAEIRRNLAGKKDVVVIDEQDIEKLPYLRAVIKETMRLYPPAPLLIPRETSERCGISGYEIEGGTTVYVNAWAIGRDPATWEDAEEFVPERFLESELDARGMDAEVIPFGFGRRACPGMGMGMCEVEVVLANILNKFEWELGDGMMEEDIDFESRPGMAMHKKNALRLVAKLVLL